MKKYEELAIKKENLKEGQKYYRVLLLTEDQMDVLIMVGRYSTLKDAKIAIANFDEEEMDEHGSYLIIEYNIQDGKRSRTKRDPIYY